MCIACTSFAAIAPRFSGGTSAISSMLIIYIIYKSEHKLRTIYHRIMFGMSCADIISSIAVGLSTLPMPAELPYDPPQEFKGTRLGTIATCEAQGFCVAFGLVAAFTYNVMLSFYNACAIAFRMEEERIVKRVEPFLHIFPVALALGCAVPVLMMDLYNPTGWDAWCSIVSVGREGTNSDYYNPRNIINLDYVIIGTSGTLFFSILITFILIIRRVRKLDKDLNRAGLLRESISVRNRRKTTVETTHQNTKIVTIQAISYFGSFCITLGISMVRGLIDEPFWLLKLSFILTPLQGFFNMCIFVFFKIYNYRRVHPGVSWWKAFKLLLGGGANDYILFSRISRVEFYREESMAVVDDEGNNYAAGRAGGVRLVQIQHEIGGNEEILLERRGLGGSECGGDVFAEDDIDVLQQDQDLSGFSSSKNPPSYPSSNSQSRGGRLNALFRDRLGLSSGISRSTHSLQEVELGNKIQQPTTRPNGEPSVTGSVEEEVHAEANEEDDGLSFSRTNDEDHDDNAMLSFDGTSTRNGTQTSS